MNGILFKSHLDDYLLRLTSTFKTQQINQIESLARYYSCLGYGYKLFLCGNGGSALMHTHSK